MSNRNDYICKLIIPTISTLLIFLSLLQPAKSATQNPEGESNTLEKPRLLGVDKNHDGIRDDLEHILVRRFGVDPRAVRVVSNLLISFQYGMISTTFEQSRDAHNKYLKAIACFSGLATQYPELDAYGLMELSSSLGNTRERQAVMEAHFQRVETMGLKTEAHAQWNADCLERYDIGGLKH